MQKTNKQANSSCPSFLQEKEELLETFIASSVSLFKPKAYLKVKPTKQNAFQMDYLQ